MTLEEVIKMYNELVDEWNELIEEVNPYLETIDEPQRVEKAKIEIEE